MKKKLLDISLVLSIILSLSLSVVVADALFGGTNWTADIEGRHPEKRLSDPGDIQVSSKSALRDGRLTVQDIDRTLLEALEKDLEDYDSAGDGALTTVLVEVVKELNAENELLKRQNLALETRISEIESTVAILTVSNN